MIRIAVIATTEVARDAADSAVSGLGFAPKYKIEPAVAPVDKVPPPADYWYAGWQDEEDTIAEARPKLEAIPDVYVYDGYTEGIDDKAEAKPPSEYASKDPEPGEKITPEVALFLGEKKAP